MRLGLELPVSGGVAQPAAIGQVAEEAERIGLDTIWTFERLLAPTAPVRLFGAPFDLPEHYRTVYSPLEVLAFAAARTSRIQLGTSILIAPLHNPVDAARRFATVDQLSGGRLVAGLGQGWMQQEYDVAGVTKEQLGRGFLDWIEAMRAAWRPDPVAYDGPAYRFPESWVAPKPVRPEGPPILVAARAATSLRRIARAGIGSNPLWSDWESLTTQLTVYRDAVREAGRDPGALPVVLRVNGDLADRPVGSGATPAGSVEQVLDAVPRLAELGVTEILWAMQRPVGEQLRLVEQVVSAVR